jgi:hypothetical protein
MKIDTVARGLFCSSLAVLIAAPSIASAQTSLPYAETISIGQAQVASAQGQRLKVNLPYTTPAGSRLPLMRVMVESVSAAHGHSAPSPEGFTVIQAPGTASFTLHSKEIITAPQLDLVLSFAGTEPKRASVQVSVPAASFSTTQFADATMKAVKPISKKPVKRVARTSPSAAKVAQIGTGRCNCELASAQVFAAPK